MHAQLGFQYLHRWRLHDLSVPVFDDPHNKHNWNMGIHSETLLARAQECLSMLRKSHMKDQHNWGMVCGKFALGSLLMKGLCHVLRDIEIQVGNINKLLFYDLNLH